MKPKLTIGIPTFNRCEKLHIQINRIVEFTEMYRMETEIIISNNASTDNTSNILNNLTNNYAFLTVYNQKINIGFVNNYRFLIENSNGEYTWIVGDDDPIYFSALDNIFKALFEKENQSLGLIHLNHCCKHSNNKIIHPRYYTINDDIYSSDGISVFTKLSQNHETGGLMFITASIFRTSLAKEAIGCWKGNIKNQALPLYVSAFSSSKEGCYFHSNISIDCIYGESFWSEYNQDIFLFHVNEVLVSLFEIGYKSSHIKKLIGLNIKSQVNRKAIIKMILKQPRKFLKLLPYLIKAYI